MMKLYLAKSTFEGKILYINNNNKTKNVVTFQFVIVNFIFFQCFTSKHKKIEWLIFNMVCDYDS